MANEITDEIMYSICSRDERTHSQKEINDNFELYEGILESDHQSIE